MGNVATRLKNWARGLKAEISALSQASRDPRTPWYAKVLALVVVAYALSPIDLIPDFIPVLGMIDDLILLPLGIALVLHFIPPEVMAEHRAKALETAHLPPSRAGIVIVAALWLVALLAIAAIMHRWRR